jgi:hypothetical protein
MQNSKSKRLPRLIEFIPARMGSRRVLLRMNTRAGSRCVLGENGSVAVSLTGAELRLLCARHWRIYRRTQYRIAAVTRRGNITHVPGLAGWLFSEVFVAADRRVRIGWEVNGRRRRPVVHLFPKVRSRVRLRRNSCTWWPSITEVDALARFYGRPIPISSMTPRATQDRLERMKKELRSLLERTHPELAQRRNSLTHSSTEYIPGAASPPQR